MGWLPLYHDMGLIGNVLQPLYVGAATYLMSPNAFLEKPFRWLKAISNYRAHTSGGPNFGYDRCIAKIDDSQKECLDLSSWRIAFSGAEPVRATTIERFSQAFSCCGFRREAFTPCYGLAEATLVVTSPSRAGSLTMIDVDREALEMRRVASVGTAKKTQLVGCGVAWPDYSVKIVEPGSKLMKGENEIGEIWVSGPSVAQLLESRNRE